MIVLIVVGGIVLAIVLSCGLMGFFAYRATTTAFNNVVGGITDMMEQSMVASAVAQYEDHEKVKELLGEVTDHSVIKREDDDKKGFRDIESVTNQDLKIKFVGSKAEGILIVKVRQGKPKRITLDVNGTQHVIDDNPNPFPEHNPSEMQKAYQVYRNDAKVVQTIGLVSRFEVDHSARPDNSTLEFDQTIRLKLFGAKGVGTLIITEASIESDEYWDQAVLEYEGKLIVIDDSPDQKMGF